ncbi:vacuolar ATPase transmembrane subunit [Tritrichomonas foetus]|uniref:V-type proton ATPase subunit a n=1 Tax=Tritrichomonas foetus TaxID=1144522 RepID=A0A1J4JY43_9EUKA|nr:vacuolar ATPase transmembrane subunit [Tritrichomonas foetus]|eukprot:OHT03376.1 vacuolar ATPase transmembrane subunit [Tritrichomonas foetus]
MTKSSIFFPEPMNSVEIICPIESAYHCISQLALRGLVQIEDVNGDNFAVPKRYSENYMQCEEAERSLRFFEEHLSKTLDANGRPLLPKAPSFQEYTITHHNMNLADTLQAIRDADAQLHEKVDLYQQLRTQRLQRQKKLQALRFYRPIIETESVSRVRRLSDTSSIELSILNDNTMISSVTGFCPSQQLRKLLTTVYRVSRRNIIYNIGEAVGEFTPYVIFVSSSAILSKIVRIAESFSPDVYEFPGDSMQLQQIETELTAEISQMTGLDQQTSEVNRAFLQDIAQSFWKWRCFICQEKQIWMTMDYGDFSIESSVIYRGWIARRLYPELAHIVETARQMSGSPVPIQIQTVTAEQLLEANEKKPRDQRKEIVVPTWIQKNNFLKGFQTLNDAYGIPNYDELNGGAFYCIYPFLFAIMFGDVGHAIFYVLIAIAILLLDPIVKKKGIDLGEIGGSVFGFKWLVVFAAICSLYCGFIYNECFGLPFSTFKSNWVVDENLTTDSLVKYKQEGTVYPFGIDYMWYFKDNELIFLNSYKMKLSVVMGILQMIFGMFLQLINHIHRRSLYEILVKWLPEMLYLVPFFGYMVVLIIMKWCTHFQGNDDFAPSEQLNGVNLIQVMIGMILNIGSEHDLSLQLYEGCWNIQNVIVMIFIISIPYLLFVKPICECVITKRKGEEINILEIFVMNLIDVIEFCLSALSHTASYLRLWALSLAHSQLSHVIYEELFVMTLDTNNPVMLFIGFAAFATLSAAILLAMEAFSALLHAIRLMWVELSSKFYSGMGTAFKSTSLKKALKKVGVRAH